jgi:opacity protein-like surface antigen
MRKKHIDDEAIGPLVVLVAILMGFAVFMYWMSSAFADGLPRTSRIAAPPASIAAPAEPAWKAHNWYIGGVAGGAWAPNSAGSDVAQAGAVAGYLWRSAVLGLGIEADYAIRDLADFSIDDGTASVRGRAGVFVGPGTFLYGTAGVAQATPATLSGDLRKGLVVGGGVEKDIAANLALRAEVLHYRHDDELLGWGEEGSTAVRGGVLFKF